MATWIKNIDEYLQTLSENGSIIEYKEKNVYFHIYYPLNRKIIVVEDRIKPRRYEDGVELMGLKYFLLNDWE